MTLETKVRKIGNSYGIIIPKEALQELNASEGSALYITESSNSSVKLTATKPDFKELMGLLLVKQYYKIFYNF